MKLTQCLTFQYHIHQAALGIYSENLKIIISNIGIFKVLSKTIFGCVKYAYAPSFTVCRNVLQINQGLPEKPTFLFYKSTPVYSGRPTRRHLMIVDSIIRRSQQSFLNILSNYCHFRLLFNMSTVRRKIFVGNR